MKCATLLAFLQWDTPGNEKPVLNGSVLSLDRIMNRDVAQLLGQLISCLGYGGARCVYALNTNTALWNISFL